MKRKFTLLIAFLISCTVSCNIYATNVSGIISSNTTWTLANSPYVITGNVLLDSGYTLTIQPGVIVKFDSLKCLQIGGTLRAIGTTVSPITFTSNQTTHVPGFWGYILFNQTSVGYDSTTHTGSVLQYCIIKFGGNQHVPNSNGVIRSDLTNSHTQNLALPYIDHCILRSNTASSIEINGTTNNSSALLRITNCEIYDNSSSAGAGGIDVSVGPINSIDPNALIITGNKVYNNYGVNGGIHASGGGNTFGVVSGNIIYNNTGDVGGGISAYSCDISENIIYNNTASPILSGYGDGSALSCNSSRIFNNLIVNNNSNSPYNTFGKTINAYGCQMYNNTVVDNIALYEVITCWPGLASSSLMNYNTITRNRVNALPPTEAVSIDEFYPVFLHNNIYGNATTYQLLNKIAQGGTNVDARYCWWGTTSTTSIDGAIWDYFDDGMLSIVNYASFRTSPDTTAPVTPPVNVIKTDMGGGNIKITWNANPDVDIAGYKIYWGSPTGYSFSHSLKTGNVTNYTLSGHAITDTIAVTAFDNDTTGIKDQFEGHESWYTYAIGKPSPVFSASPLSVCPGDTVYFTASTPNLYPYANTTWTWSFPGGSPAISSSQLPKVIYNAPGIYNVKLKVTNIAGSDSLTYNNYIHVKSPSYNTISPNICNTGYYTSPSGNYTWSSNGTYQDTIPNHVGCDSILTIHLTLNYDSYNTINPEACRSYTSPSGNYIWTASNSYFDTIPNHVGCDSVITINLTVYNLDTSITLAGNTLTANAAGVGYQWLNCGNGYAVISGETNQSFSPVVSGNFAVQITQSICIDTSLCHHIVIVGLEDLDQSAMVNIYPNPAKEYFTVILDKSLKGYENLQIKLYDLPGKELKTLKIKNNEKISRSGLSNGVYFYEIFDGSTFLKRGKIIME